MEEEEETQEEAEQAAVNEGFDEIEEDEE